MVRYFSCKIKASVAEHMRMTVLIWQNPIGQIHSNIHLKIRLDSCWNISSSSLQCKKKSRSVLSKNSEYFYWCCLASPSKDASIEKFLLTYKVTILWMRVKSLWILKANLKRINQIQCLKWLLCTSKCKT